jgi:hypothetical protein
MNEIKVAVSHRGGMRRMGQEHRDGNIMHKGT